MLDLLTHQIKLYAYILFLCLGLVWLWYSRVPPDAQTTPVNSIPRRGFPAPNFSLINLHNEVIALKELRGQPVLINFWASWCPPCKAEIPALDAVSRANRDSGLVILGINTTQQDSLTKARDFAADYAISYPILLDLDNKVTTLYQVSSLPTTFFVDRQGIIQEVIVGGPLSEALLRIKIEQLLRK